MGVHIDRWGDADETLLLVHGSNAGDPASAWTRQRELAERFRLLVMHRRGYGQSPGVEKRDFAVDVADIIDALASEGPGHLVGFSYGGVLSLLATAQRPDLVLSLTMIEPPAYSVARGHPDVEQAIERMSPLFAHGCVETISPEEFIRGFRAVLGIQPIDPGPLSERDRRGIRGTLAEPPPWLADIPLDALAETRVPMLVVSGEWNDSLEAVADVLTERLPADRAIIRGAGHSVQHTGRPFNERLASFIGGTSRRAEQTD